MRRLPSVFLAFVLGVMTGRHIGCVEAIQAKIGGNFTCEAPEYDVPAMDCAFRMDCNTLDVGFDLEAWRCESMCYFLKDVSKQTGKIEADLDLNCTFTSTDAK